MFINNDDDDTVCGHCDVTLTLYGHIKTAEQRTIMQQYSQWRSQRGGGWGVQTPIRIEAVFFTAVKSLLLNIITSL